MESPLNLAHLQDRRAESFLRYGRFADAMACHEKASEYLVEAMKMTEVTQALVSMKLQYASHLRQQKVLKEKWKRYELQKKMKEERTQKLKEQEVQEEKNCTLSAAAVPGDMIDGNQLNPSQTSSLVISAENFSVSSISSCSEGPGKDEQDSVNSHAQELQMQVLSLSQALEDSNRENAKLRKIINNIKEFVQNKFGYELDEEHFLEQGIAHGIHKTASLKETELALPDDVMDTRTKDTVLLKEIESCNSMACRSSNGESALDEFHCKDAMTEIKEHQSELSTDRLGDKEFSVCPQEPETSFHEDNVTDQQIDSITLAPLEKPDFDSKKENSSELSH